MCFVVVAFYVPHPALQIMALNYFSIISLVYIGNNRPLNEQSKNSLELFNETIVISLALHLFLFTDFVPDQLSQYNVGFNYISLLTLLIVVNCCFILKKVLRDIYLIWVKYYRIIKHFINKRLLNMKYKAKNDVKSVVTDQVTDNVDQEQVEV